MIQLSDIKIKLKITKRIRIIFLNPIKNLYYDCVKSLLFNDSVLVVLSIFIFCR